MKNIFILIMIFAGSFMTCTAQTEKLDKFFQSFENKSGVTSIDIKKPMFDLLDRIEISDEYIGKIKPIMRDVNGLKLLVFSKATFPDHLKSENLGQIKMNEEKSERVSKLLSTLNFNELMSMKSDDVSMKFLAENAKDGILENLIFNVDSKDEIAIFMLNGKMKMDDVNRIINSDELVVPSARKPEKNTKANTYKDSYETNEVRHVGNFSKLEVSTGVKVNFTQESTTLVKVFADADKLQNVITKVENGVLKIYVENKSKKNLNFKSLTVNVSSPKIEMIKTSSGAIFNAASDVNEDMMIVDASSGSVVNASFNVSNSCKVETSSGSVINSKINTKDLSVKGSSGSAINISGNSEAGVIDMSSGAVCNGEGLKVNGLQAEASSGSVLSAHVVTLLNATASSGGIIRYKGNPEIQSKISKMSGGSLQQIK
ncbi:DUF4252 domain-containing protein [Chryseobacterium sp.]|uniref:DUF4252 domain-containing protein n=1 Tax=Chryseobacterium sp. TaxID=1871047 RepID=UPI002898D4FB|nr:DUF4252 domain-containing protein [Chryseobacterium sp.]